MNKGSVSTSVAILIAALVAGTGILSYVSSQKIVEEQDQLLGAINFVGAKTTRLGGSGVSATDTSINLVSLRTPNDAKIVTADFGEIGYGTLEPRGTNKEFVSFTGVTQNADGSATLTGVTRGLNFVSPYTASTTLRKAHPGGSTFVISNPPQLYNTQVSKFNDSFVSSTVTYSSSAIPRLHSTGTYGAGTELYLATKNYVDNVATSGAADASVTQKGLVEIATVGEVIVGTNQGGTGALLVAPNNFFNATSSATSTVPVTGGDGKLSQGFIDLVNDDWVFSSTNFTVSSTNINFGTSSMTGLLTLVGTFPTGNQAVHRNYLDAVIASSTPRVLASTTGSGVNFGTPNFTIVWSRNRALSCNKELC